MSNLLFCMKLNSQTFNVKWISTKDWKRGEECKTLADLENFPSRAISYKKEKTLRNLVHMVAKNEYQW